MTLVIIQARLTSTRFPRKVLEKLEGRTLIQRVVDAALEAKLVDKVVVASPHHIEYKGADWFIGSEYDVLDRYYQCAKEYKGDPIVRITSDCPMLRGIYIDTAINFFNTMKTPYIHFALLDGLNVEVFNFKILETAWKKTKNPYDREHVTPFMQRATKISIDTPKELKEMREWIKDGKKPKF